MNYTLKFSQRALKDIDQLKKSGNQAVLKKLQILLEEMTVTPRLGTGKPEMLKHDFSGYWSRRINKEHRIVYSINDSILVIMVVAVKGHYS